MKVKEKSPVAKSKKINKGQYGFYFVLPFFIGYLLFQLYPMIYTFYLSLTSWNGITAVKEFVGLDNYARLLSDNVFLKSIFNTILIWIMSVIPRMAVALLIAVLLTQFKKIKGGNFFRAVFYFPNLVNASSVAVLLALILDWQTGALNNILLKLNLIAEPIKWLSSPFYARSAVAITIWWMWFGHSMVLLMTGILSVPEELLESATIDGAGQWKKFTAITFPLLRPTFSYVFVTSLIGGLQNFDIPRILTDGLGTPDKSILTSVMHLYNLAFRSQQFGYGATIAYGLFVIVLFVSIITFRVINPKSQEGS